MPLGIAAAGYIGHRFGLRGSLKYRVSLGMRCLMISLCALVLAAPTVLLSGSSSAAWLLVDASDSARSLQGRITESAQTALKLDGNFDGEGEITYASSNAKVATVAADGTVTAVGKGQANVTATLTRNGKRVVTAQAQVKVLRAVTKVTLSTAGLSIYEPTDPAVSELLPIFARAMVTGDYTEWSEKALELLHPIYEPIQPAPDGTLPENSYVVGKWDGVHLLTDNGPKGRFYYYIWDMRLSEVEDFIDRIREKLDE